MRLDKRSSVPLYAQLKSLLAERIESGEYRPGEKIPTELQLCRELELSRPTVRQAIAELVSEGQLIIMKGKGTFVRKAAKRIVIDDFSAFSFSFLSSQSYDKDDFLEYKLMKNIPPEIAEIFSNNKNYPCFRLMRSSEFDQHTIALSTSYIPEKFFPGLDESITLGRRMIEITANRYAYLPQQFKQHIFCRQVSAEEAVVLDLPKGVTVLISRSVLASRSGQVCEVNETVFNPDRVTLQIENRS